MRGRFLLGFLVGQMALFGFAVLATADSVHVVLPGDTLSALGARFGVGVDRLAAHNGLPSPDHLYIGQHLSIPQDRPAAGATAAGGHLVAQGETLGDIAARYGTTVDALVKTNNLASPNLIWSGIRLRLPDTAALPPGEVAAQAAATVPPRSIVIDLGDSRLYAYEGDALLQAFAISSGGPGTATPVGQFKIWRRLPRQDMSGPGYFAPDVPWVQYFHGSYALHGTYWHDSFGRPVSHGCVNMRTPEAQWLYYWADLGTPVEVRW